MEIQPDNSPSTHRPRPGLILQRLLARRDLPVWVAAVGMLLTLPALWTGLQPDEIALHLALRGESVFPAQRAAPTRLFSFLDGDTETNRRLMDAGLLPWWTADALRLNFFRPLTALTHALDQRLWPNTPALMHAQSLLWYGLLVTAVALLYRRILARERGNVATRERPNVEAAPVSAFSRSDIPTADTAVPHVRAADTGVPHPRALWAAGLAALLFAVDDARTSAVTWIASRNLLISALLAVLALLFHDRWRRGGRWWTGVLAPACLLLALLAGEAAAAIGAYFLAYAAFLERGTWRSRIASLLPAVGVGAAWYAFYVASGYGTFGSGIYLDPAHDPGRFAGESVPRGLLLFLGLWAYPPSDLAMILSSGMVRTVLGLAVVIAVLVIFCMLPLLRRDARARFFATGMVLSFAPFCATIPADRLLLLPGIGAMGLIALFVSHAGRQNRERKRAAGAKTNGPRAVLGLAIALIVIHAVIAPIVLPIRTANERHFGRIADVFVNLPEETRDLAHRHAIIVRAPAAHWSMFLHLFRRDRDLSLPHCTHVLATGRRAVRLSRPDPRTLVVRPRDGFLVPPRFPPHGRGTPAPLISWAYMMQLGDRAFRGDPAIPVDLRRRFHDVTIDVTAQTPDGRPTEITCRFDRPLDDEDYVWLDASGGKFKAFRPPAIGQERILPAVQ